MPITREALDLMVRWARRLDYVPRWSIVPTINKQSVSAHTYQATQIARWLLEHHTNGDDAAYCLDVICYSLDHDLEEAAEGDAPTPSKPLSVPDPEDQMKVIIKCADIIEAICFVQEEIVMGNAVRMRPIKDDLHQRLHPWWLAFNWDERWDKKPLTSDIIRTFVTNIQRAPFHPGLEGHNV